MPLIKGKSKQAFSDNVSAEMDAGKPQDQALAIAYRVRQAAMKRKMFGGGRVKEPQDTQPKPQEPQPKDEQPGEHFKNSLVNVKKSFANATGGMADGGRVTGKEGSYIGDDLKTKRGAPFSRVANEVLAHYKAGMADGGEVIEDMREDLDIEDLEDQNLEALMKELYDEGIEESHSTSLAQDHMTDDLADRIIRKRKMSDK